MQSFIDNCNRGWPKNFQPYNKICLDECMIKYNGRLKFKQFIKNKPVKWGIKCFLLCDCKTNYCLKIQVYTGKSEENSNKRPTERIVEIMTMDYLQRWKTLYTDSSLLLIL